MLLVSKKKIGGNLAFFRDNKASIWEKKTPDIALYFTGFWNIILLPTVIISKKCMVTPILFLDFSSPC